MADKKGGPATDVIMSAAEMKPLLMLSKRDPVSAVIGMTKNKEGLILLNRRIKPKKLLAQLKTDARKAKLELDIISLRFGKAEVDTDKDSALVVFTVNKDPPGSLRMKLLEVVKRVPYQKVEIDVDAKIEDEPEDEDTPAAPPPKVDLRLTPALFDAAQHAADATKSTPPVPLPPDGMMTRKIDGHFYWQPNPESATWGHGGGPPAPDSWIDGFFDYYDLAPPPDPNPDTNQDCVFNQAPSSVQTVLDTLVQQATLAGYTASRSTAQAAVRKLLADRAGGRQSGAAMAKHDPTADDVAALAQLETPALLDALEVLRKGRKLDALVEIAASDHRVLAAILTVQQHLGVKWQALMQRVDQIDKKGLLHHLYQRTMSGDVGDEKELVKVGGGRSYTAPDVSDTEWIDGFLKFFELRANPMDDGMHGTCLFNGRTEYVSDVLDMTVYQAMKDDHLIDRGLVAKVAMPMILPPAPSPGGSKRITYYLGIGVVPWTGHLDLKTHQKTSDPPATQFGATVTLELHPENGSGPELSLVAQVTANDDPNNQVWQVTNYLTGFQAAWVKSWFDGALQLGPVLQVLGGAMRAQQAKDGTIRMVSAGQVTIGAQLAYQFTIPNSKMKLQIAVQAGGSATVAHGAHPTLDVPVQLVAQVPF